MSVHTAVSQTFAQKCFSLGDKLTHNTLSQGEKGRKQDDTSMRAAAPEEPDSVGGAREDLFQVQPSLRAFQSHSQCSGRTRQLFILHHSCCRFSPVSASSNSSFWEFYTSSSPNARAHKCRPIHMSYQK